MRAGRRPARRSSHVFDDPETTDVGVPRRSSWKVVARFGGAYGSTRPYTSRSPTRTTIVIDETLIAAAQRATGIQTKGAVVEEGLRMLVRLHRQSAVTAWRGQLRWEGDLEAMRIDDRA